MVAAAWQLVGSAANDVATCVGVQHATCCACLQHMDRPVTNPYSCCPPPAGVRLLRASKNRYGHGGALGVLSMDSGGLAAVANPSALFLADSTSGSRAASGITVVLEGNRPLVVEAQVTAHLPARRCSVC